MVKVSSQQDDLLAEGPCFSRPARVNNAIYGTNVWQNGILAIVARSMGLASISFVTLVQIVEIWCRGCVLRTHARNVYAESMWTKQHTPFAKNSLRHLRSVLLCIVRPIFG